MKLDEITDIKHIEEIAPAGMLKRAATGIGKKVASAVGAKTAAARLGGTQQTQQQANMLFRNFNAYLGQIGKKLGTATSGDVQNFMQSQRMVVPPDIKRIPAQNVVPKDMISKAFMTSAQSTVQRQTKQAATQPQQQQGGGAGGSLEGGFKSFVSGLSSAQKQQLKSLL